MLCKAICEVGDYLFEWHRAIKVIFAYLWQALVIIGYFMCNEHEMIFYPNAVTKTKQIPAAYNRMRFPHNHAAWYKCSSSLGIMQFISSIVSFHLAIYGYFSFFIRCSRTLKLFSGI